MHTLALAYFDARFAKGRSIKYVEMMKDLGAPGFDDDDPRPHLNCRCSIKKTATKQQSKMALAQEQHSLRSSGSSCTAPVTATPRRTQMRNRAQLPHLGSCSKKGCSAGVKSAKSSFCQKHGRKAWTKMEVRRLLLGVGKHSTGDWTVSMYIAIYTPTTNNYYMLHHRHLQLI